MLATPKSTASLRPTSSRAALLAACAALCAATPAVAQQPQRPAGQRPAAQPAAPAQPAPAAPAGGQQAGPTIVQVKPEPSQTDWVKVCGKDPGNQKEICYTTRDFVSDQGQPVLAVAVYDVKGEPNRVVRFLMPLGLLLQPGIRFGVDTGQPTAGRYAICLPNGCFAEANVPANAVDGMKRGTNLNISVQNQAAREVTFSVPLAGFGKGFDGAPIDPAVLQAQQQKLQEELQKRATEQRQQMQATPGSPGAPVAPPVAGAPAAPRP